MNLAEVPGETVNYGLVCTVQFLRADKTATFHL